MRTPPTIPPAALAAALAAVLAGCAQPPGAARPYRLSGTLRDATTNEPISRRTVYLHFFCDDAGFQESLEREDEATFDVRLPTPNVRIRASDPERAFAFRTETFTLTDPETRRDILLQPTGYVLLRARVVDATGAAVVPARPSGRGVPAVGGGGPLFYLRSDADAFSADLVGLDDSGAFAVRVPRAVISIAAVDTALAPVEATLDLSRVEGPAFDHVLRME